MEKLTKTEERVMHILWKLKKALVRDVMKEMGNPEPKYTTVSSVVRILVDKGFVGFKAYGRTHEYFPIISQKDYKKFTFREMTRDYFDGSYENVVSFMLEEEELNDAQIKEIQSLIDKLKD